MGGCIRIRYGILHRFHTWFIQLWSTGQTIWMPQADSCPVGIFEFWDDFSIFHIPKRKQQKTKKQTNKETCYCKFNRLVQKVLMRGDQEFHTVPR